MFVSVVVPCYNEEEVIEETYKRLKNVLVDIREEHEVLFVNDGSADMTLQKLKVIAEKDKCIKIIELSRNFGHQTAITAGMEMAVGDVVVVIDADLQDPPELIPEMIKQYKAGYEVVYAVREKRMGESIFKKITAKAFYRILRSLTDIEIPVDTGDFRLISRRVCEVLKSMPERSRFVRGLTSWIGFNQIGIKYNREERFAGETKYPLKRMIKLSIDGITSFSTKPLKIATYLGLLSAFGGVLYAVYIVLSKIIGLPTQPGWASLVVLIMVMNGVQLVIMGIIGEYIARIFEESKGRPKFIVKDMVNLNNEKM